MPGPLHVGPFELEMKARDAGFAMASEYQGGLSPGDMSFLEHLRAEITK